MSHPNWGHAAKSVVVPGVTGGMTSDAVLLIIAIVGTTVAPWQLFFQQSNIVDKRILSKKPGMHAVHMKKGTPGPQQAQSS